MKKKDELYFPQKSIPRTKSSAFSEENEPNLTFRKCVQRGSKILKIHFGWGRVANAPGL